MGLTIPVCHLTIDLFILLYITVTVLYILPDGVDTIEHRKNGSNGSYDIKLHTFKMVYVKSIFILFLFLSNDGLCSFFFFFSPLILHSEKCKTTHIAI